MVCHKCHCEIQPENDSLGESIGEPGARKPSDSSIIFSSSPLIKHDPDSDPDYSGFDASWGLPDDWLNMPIKILH